MRVEQLSNGYLVPLVQVALAWFLAKSQVVAPMIGVHKYEHLCSDVDALSLSLTSEDMAFLEETYVSHELVCPFSPGEPGIIE